MIDGALAAVRAVHFAATLLLEGSLVFRVLVAQPLLCAAAKDAQPLRRPLTWMIVLAWIVGLLSGAAWLLILGGQVADSSLAAAVSDGTDWTLLTQTQFGQAWQWRGAGFALLGLWLATIDRAAAVSRLRVVVPIALGVALAASLAWAGHGAATPGEWGDLHLAADSLHLVVSGLWLGGLPALAVLLLDAQGGRAPMQAVEMTTRRFSSVATASVLILLPTGIANGWFILGSVSALTGTLYGQLLLAKIGLFLLMLAFAAVNRLALTPQLGSPAAAPRAAERLAIHSGCEIALGIAILAIVGVLGTLNPEMSMR